MTTNPVSLPAPSLTGEVSVEVALATRRSHRSFASTPLSLAQLGQLSWAADGVTATVRGTKLRTAPSAGALYPVDLYVVVGTGGVTKLPPGVYHYDPTKHELNLIKGGELRRRVALNALSQMWIASAPVIFVVTGESARCTRKYGPRGEIYTHIEVGHVGQNIFLQAVALGLGAGIVGAFEPQVLAQTLSLPEAHVPFVVLPAGVIK